MPGAAPLRPCPHASRPSAVSAPSAPSVPANVPPPPGVVDLDLASGTHSLWPFTTACFPARPQDPINLIFAGEADLRNIRAALLSLDGDRPGFPGASVLPILGERWKDAIGEIQAAYSAAEGWTGSAIQLELGDFDTLRFHIRLFAAGGCTLANAHLDVPIPGTASHEVVSWELARRLLVYDLERSGLLDPDTPPFTTEPLHPLLFRQIPPAVFAGLGELESLLLETGSITPRGCLRTGEGATVLTLARAALPTAERARHEVTIHFDAVVPRPFCTTGGEWIHVHGPVRLRQEVHVEPLGRLSSHVGGSGELRVTPVDPQTRQPLGPPLRGRVSETYTAVVTDEFTITTMLQDRLLLGGAVPWQQEWLHMQVGPDNRVRYVREERCELPPQSR
jgi:hypothetical protein